MNGVSHMLPLVVGGGILIALAFLIDGLSVDLSSLPADQRAVTAVAEIMVAGDFNIRSLTTRNARDL